MTSTIQPISTTTVADWSDVESYLAEHTSDAAYPLTALTALHDADQHHIVLDPKTRTIWWAYDNSPLLGQGWTIDHLAPQDAATQASNPIDILQDQLAELLETPEKSPYALGHGNLDGDLEALDEYAAIVRLTVPQDPREARAHIQSQRDRIARAAAQEDAPWRLAYVGMVRELANLPGGKKLAGERLGITDVQVGRLIRDEDQRREVLANAVAAGRAAWDQRGATEYDQG